MFVPREITGYNEVKMFVINYLLRDVSIYVKFGSYYTRDCVDIITVSIFSRLKVTKQGLTKFVSPSKYYIICKHTYYMVRYNVCNVINIYRNTKGSTLTFGTEAISKKKRCALFCMARKP